jgi:Uncharacterized protein conserved in bacteria (DUF2252)
VIISVVYLLVRCLLGCLIVVTRHQVSKDSELLVLRHENAVLRRQISRVRYQPGDRLWLAALSPGCAAMRICRTSAHSPRPRRRLLFDLNDFDEPLPGPFEYDVKRMAASFAIVARNNANSNADTREATMASVTAYREAMAGFAQMQAMNIWYAHLDENELMKPVHGVLAETAEAAKKGPEGARKQGEADVESMPPVALTFYVRSCGWTLARAHARCGDPVAITACVGGSDAFDRSITDFSQRYADRTSAATRSSSRRSDPDGWKHARVPNPPGQDPIRTAERSHPGRRRRPGPDTGDPPDRYPPAPGTCSRGWPRSRNDALLASSRSSGCYRPADGAIRATNSTMLRAALRSGSRSGYRRHVCGPAKEVITGPEHGDRARVQRRQPIAKRLRRLLTGQAQQQGDLHVRGLATG